MKVADYTSSAQEPLTLRVSMSSAADLLCSLWILSDRRNDDALEDLDLGDPWFAALEDDLSPETVANLDRIGSGEVWIAMLPTLPETGEGGTVASFLTYLKGMDPADLRFALMNVQDLLTDVPRDVVADAAEGKLDAVETILSVSCLATPEKKRWRETLRYLLMMEPVETQQLIVDTLERFQSDAFATREATFRPFLEADYRSKRSMARRVSPERLLELATSGINFSEGSAKRLPIVLMPTMVARPWVVFASGPDYFVLGYPVGDEFLDEDPDAPPTWLVKLHKALGDERRLRVLRTLAEGDASLADLADQVDIAKSTLHHHLMLLRAAGLVRVHVGEEKRYSLRNEALGDANRVLDHYIHGTADSEEAR
jgi:DNA-binding transcriptional ArsR family regulator